MDFLHVCICILLLQLVMLEMGEFTLFFILWQIDMVPFATNMSYFDLRMFLLLLLFASTVYATTWLVDALAPSPL